ncbi:hypothetical protein [Nocardia aurea]|uniref:hypothetical protein n=1 Tax=Nocardia aurea TaxID=2144174 RepID=UPI000D69D933|nr:hypothetical protein [Nocardia aurea]
MDTLASRGAGPELHYTVELRWCTEPQAWWKTRHLGSPIQIAAALDELVVRIHLDPAVVRACRSGAAQVCYRAVGWQNHEIVEKPTETIGLTDLSDVLHSHASALREIATMNG